MPREQDRSALARPVPRIEEAHPVARMQFIRNLERQASKEQEDARLYAAWKARQPQIQADMAYERKVLAYAFAVALVLAAVVAVGVVAFLMAYGVPIAIALTVALLVGGSSGGGCTVIVTHICGH